MPFTVRRIDTGDAETVSRYRRAMFEELDDFEPAALDECAAAFVPYLEQAIPEQRYVGWLAEEASRPLGTAGLVFHDFPPHPLGTAMRVGYVLNVYVEPDARSRGVATALVEAAVGHCRGLGLARVALHASDAGAPVYGRLGFERTSEMRLNL